MILQVSKGDKYNRLTIIKELPFTRCASNKMVRWFKVQCECGSKLDVRLQSLRSGNTKSCGCLHADVTVTHGLTNHPLYQIYYDMHRRCYDKEDRYYEDYGGKGIAVCKRWLKKEDSYQGLINFIEDMGDKPNGTTIDRKNNSKGYSPTNCRWATPLQQVLNRSNTFIVWAEGKFVSFRTLWHNKGRRVSYHTAYNRVRCLGWKPLLAVTAPVESLKGAN